VKQEVRMVKSKILSGVINLTVWITGILVSLAVGFGMVDQTLTIWLIPVVVTEIAGWVVVVLTIISLILAIVNKI
jgi:hypothetical protein